MFPISSTIMEDTYAGSLVLDQALEIGETLTPYLIQKFTNIFQEDTLAFRDLTEDQEAEVILNCSYNMLPVVLYAVDDPKDFAEVTRGQLEHALEKVAICDENLRKLGEISEENKERRRYLEAGLQELISAQEYCSQQLDSSEKIETDSWKPFTKSRFNSDSRSEWIFMLQVRQLFLNHRQMNKMEILEELNAICCGFYPVALLRSRTSYEAAMWAMDLILKYTLLHAPLPDIEISRRVIKESETFVLRLNMNLCDCAIVSSEGYTHLLLEREGRLADCFADLLKNLYKSMFDRAPEDGSALWNKFQTASSINSFMDGGVYNCAICQTDYDISNRNFAIMDKCEHLFCVDCIDTWFEAKTSCPNCRGKIKKWTSRDIFLAIKGLAPASNDAKEG